MCCSKQRAAYYMRMSDWSSDVCSADLLVEKTTGTAHIAVLPGVARNPRGDIVLCDVAREAADGLLRDPRERERKSVGEGKGVSVRVNSVCRRVIKKTR